ncbi:hypothetical protein F4553_000202 [Allocatelliglobosispora scoriae]|uniref:Uncharacterized protein n=1 Tax=Allocatelliglobosispora scoriae TaxID=643052 RepID=A0A841BID2_9ACTN|nr:hypothetical protein [Allocatelliglobosispora scoriae]MBB5866823.1 hypothetical protein [Allocatelliglobosispora scoriae]
MTSGATSSGRVKHREAFWTLVVGLPAAFSVLRLWVESGGELQITLLLVSNVGPANLAAALFATVTQLVTVVLIALFAIGGILWAALDAAPPESRLREFPPLVLRLALSAPGSIVVVAFVLALLTWKILYLPLLVPAAVAVVQRPPWRIHGRWQAATALTLAALAGYAWLVGPAVLDAWAAREHLVAVLLALPPLVALGVAGPVPERFARAFATIALVALLGVVATTADSAIRTPILPLTVTKTQVQAEASAEPEAPPEFIRGYVITANDAHLVILQEHGGVRYVPIGDVVSTVLCGTAREIPAFTTRVRTYHVEDSLLSASGRQVRPQVRIDPQCRIAAPAEVR